MPPLHGDEVGLQPLQEGLPLLPEEATPRLLWQVLHRHQTRGREHDRLARGRRRPGEQLRGAPLDDVRGRHRGLRRLRRQGRAVPHHLQIPPRRELHGAGEFGLHRVALLVLASLCAPKEDNDPADRGGVVKHAGHVPAPFELPGFRLLAADELGPEVVVLGDGPERRDADEVNVEHLGGRDPLGVVAHVEGVHDGRVHWPDVVVEEDREEGVLLDVEEERLTPHPAELRLRPAWVVVAHDDGVAPLEDAVSERLRRLLGAHEDLGPRDAVVEAEVAARRWLLVRAPDQRDGTILGVSEERAYGGVVCQIHAVVQAAVRAIEHRPVREEPVSALTKGVELGLNPLVQVDPEGPEDHGERAPRALQLLEQVVEGRQEPHGGVRALGVGGLRPAQVREEPVEVRPQGLAGAAGVAEGPQRLPPPLLRGDDVVWAAGPGAGHGMGVRDELRVADEAVPGRVRPGLGADQQPHLRVVVPARPDAPGAAGHRHRQQVLGPLACQRVRNQHRVVHVEVQHQVRRHVRGAPGHDDRMRVRVRRHPIAVVLVHELALQVVEHAEELGLVQVAVPGDVELLDDLLRVLGLQDRCLLPLHRD
mmetsp:Transcript_119803/g.339549  ORF Transcript_119803/g.339549 Transcript_119803/m.339549 type:complete len:592 (-) Transcript_119803:491-2266(-)